MGLTTAASLHCAAAERMFVPGSQIGLEDDDFDGGSLEPGRGIHPDLNPTKMARSDGSEVDLDQAVARLQRD